MKKMPSLFDRDYENRAEDGGHKVVDRVLPAARWVAEGEGVATRKWDGLAALVKDGSYFKRYDAKAGRSAPEGFKPAQPAPDEKTGHWPGWLAAKLPEDRWLLEGMAWGSKNLFGGGAVPDGTYEVCGPKIGTRHGANPEGLSEHVLVPHGKDVMAECPRDYEGLRSYLASRAIEGVVWHHPDGRMAKIKKNDFPPRPKPALKL